MNEKIGRYTEDEILEHLTEGEGRGFLGRSMYDAIFDKIHALKTENQQLQQENQQLKDNWNELKTIIQTSIIATEETAKEPDSEFITTIKGTFGRVLNMMQELEIGGADNE